MSSAFKRKVYGKVRPVPKAKEKPPVRPAVSDLRAIYTQIKRSPESKLVDLLSEALLWWNNSIGFIQWKYKKAFPLAAAKAFQAASNAASAGRLASKNEDRANGFILALASYRRYASGAGVKVPDLAPYLKQSKEVTKKVKVRNKQLTIKFDSLLTLMEQCFNEPSLSFEVCESDEDRKWDHTLGKIYYSRSKVVAMKKQLFQKGLLSIVIEEADFIARGLSLTPGVGAGSFIHNPELTHKNYIVLLERFENFAHHPQAPKALVKRDKKPKKKGVK